MPKLVLPKRCPGLILQCLILSKCSTMAITMSKDNKDNLPVEFSARGIGRSLAQCFGSDEKLQCLEMQFVQALDAAVRDNATWQYSDFLAVEKRISEKSSVPDIKLPSASSEHPQLERRSLSDTIGEKLLQLATSRSIRLTLPQLSGISDALDDLASSSAAANVADDNADEGRKKKDKDKNMAMMGGMAMLAMVAQLFLGKVILIAGAAFVMAKIALLVSVLSSLKKGTSGGSGSTDHVIVTSGGGGGGGGGHNHDSVSSGWHRSMPHAYDYSKIEVASGEHKVSEHTPPTGISHNDGLTPESSSDHGWSPVTGTSEGTHKPSYYNYELTENAVDDNYKRRQMAGFL